MAITGIRTRTAERGSGGLPAGSDAGRLVRAAVGATLRHGNSAAFLRRRAIREVSFVASDELRRTLGAILGEADASPVDHGRLRRALLCWAGRLEASGRVDEAVEVVELDAPAERDDPALLLHRARLARKSGDRDRALALYREVDRLAGGDSAFGRLAAVGEALVSGDPERALGRAARRSLRAGDGETAAVALEARAHHRREGGDGSGAVRDYLVAGARYTDATDRGRVLHEAADVLAGVGDALAARELLLAATRIGRPEQRAYARDRLHELSRAVGDDLGRRRWAPATPSRAGLVSLTPSRRWTPPVDSLRDRVRGWLERLDRPRPKATA